MSRQGWRDHAIGRAYLSLYPNKCDVLKSKGLFSPVANVAQAGLLTLNFERPYHRDPKDKNMPTHCSWSPPSFWVAAREQNNNFIGTGFAMGNTVVDLTECPTRISFMPYSTYHCTAAPCSIPIMPDELLGKKGYERIHNDQFKTRFYEFVCDSVIAFGSWSWFRNNRTRLAEYNRVREQAGGERNLQRQLNRELYSRWEAMGFTRESEGQRMNRNARRGMRARLRRQRRRAENMRQQLA